MKKLTFAALMALSVLQMSSCDILRNAMNNPQNTTYRCVPMTQAEFAPAHSRVAGTTFASDKLNTAKQVTQNGGCMTANQIAQITSLFTFEGDKLTYAKFAYPYCADPKNYGVINSHLTYESSKRELGQLTGVN
jgi:hypothetical protein